MAYLKKSIGFYCFVCVAAILGALLLSRAGSAIAVLAQTADAAPTVVIDAGHGGEDGGAVSVTGVSESNINLEISLRLNDLLHFLGVETKMIRTSDISVYTEGTTIAQKKVSDIHHRVSLIEETPNALLVSIHQNHFTQAQYRGAQVFYTAEGKTLAENLQRALAEQVDTKNHRACKPVKDVYLMQHVTCPAVLVECGFLSNPVEEALLRDAGYQKKLAAAIGCGVAAYLEETNEV